MRTITLGLTAVVLCIACLAPCGARGYALAQADGANGAFDGTAGGPAGGMQGSGPMPVNLGSVSPAGVALLGFGVALTVVASVWLIVAAFIVHPLWGLACLFLPFAGLVFTFMHWSKAAKPFLIGLAGAALLAGGGAMTASGLGTTLQAMALQTTVTEAPAPPWPPETADDAGDAGEGTENGRSIRVGDRIEDVVEAFGRPTGRLEKGSTLVLLYPGFTVLSEDGKKVDTVEFEEDYMPIAKVDPSELPAAPGSRSGMEPVLTIAEFGRRVDTGRLLVPGKVTIVDFYADWCPPCRALSPELEKLARGDRGIVLRKVDIVNWNSPVAQQYGIRSVPSVRVYNGRGKQVGEPTHSLSAIKRNVEAARKSRR